MNATAIAARQQDTAPAEAASITPTPAQLKVIRDIVTWYGDRSRPGVYLAGYAGVGKTTIAK